MAPPPARDSWPNPSRLRSRRRRRSRAAGTGPRQRPLRSARKCAQSCPSAGLQESFRTAWESLVLRANGHATTRATPHTRVDRATLRAIDLHWHDLRHEGACRLLADGVDIRTIQLMLGHADIKQTQRYLNITDEELRRAMTGVWERRRQLRLSAPASQPGTDDAKASGQ
ncbi:MAG: tyrosine-type recombinase/integrase [Acidobacteria bacterium]|nr:tyrosine-type recombinase/integrase [Acidobacteriota bacterium]